MKTMIVDDIDLLNVSFDGESAPDRISSRAGLKELQKIAPSRRSIDFDVSDFISVYMALNHFCQIFLILVLLFKSELLKHHPQSI